MRDESCPAAMSRLIPAILSHQSAEYFPPIIASRQRMNGARYMQNHGEIMYAVPLYAEVSSGAGGGVAPLRGTAKPVKFGPPTA
jgi:hypothetical protein